MYSKAEARKDSVRTPPYILKWVRKKFGKYYDPVPYNPSFDPKKNKDALTTEWKAVNYVNPPYSKASQFVRKGYEQYRTGKTVVLLVKTNVLGTKTFSECPGAEIVLFPEAVVFPGYSGTPRFHVCLLLYRARKRSTKYSFFKK